MRIADSERELKRRIRDSGRTVEGLGAVDAVSLMTSFYRQVRAVDAAANEVDGDGLLHQWGIYDWGSGETFEFDLTRQFIAAGDVDNPMWQLHLTLKYEPLPLLRALGRGNFWCWSPEDIAEFDLRIRSGAWFKPLEALHPISVEARLEQV